MANLQVTSQPRNNELLWLQESHNHRSYAVFHNQITSTDTLTVRRCDGRFWTHIKNHPIHENVFQHIRNAGFEGVFNSGFHKIDHGLITAMVERWRPETHTFHLPVGEATITLEDVQVMLGLPVDAPVVSGTWYVRTKAQWMARCQELLGFEPEARHIDGGSYKMTALVRHLDDPLADNDVAYQQRARIYILALLGGMLLADSSGNLVPLNYIEHLVDLSVAGRLSWGSAVLAFLYKNLCEAARDSNCQGIQGGLLLVQYWAWIRIPSTAPIVKQRFQEPYNYQQAYAARWNYTLSLKDTTAHVLIGYRSLLTALTPEQFIWRPYVQILDRLPEECREGQHLWGYQGYIIFWHVVEQHLPERVARQFGFVQQIPPNGPLWSPETHVNIHNLTRSGRRNTDWLQRLQDPFVLSWLNRANTVFEGQQMTPHFTTSQGYMQWYFDRTVLCITDPGYQAPVNQYPEWGGRQQLYQEGYRNIQQMAADEIARNPTQSQVLQHFAEFPTQIMQYGHMEERMNYSSQNFNFPDYNAYRPFPPSPPVQSHYHHSPFPGGQSHQFTGGPSNQFTGGPSNQFPGVPSNTGNVYVTPSPFPGYLGTPSSHTELFNIRRDALDPDYQLHPQYRHFDPIPMEDYASSSHSGRPDINEMPEDLTDLGADDDDNDDDNNNDDDDDDDDEPEQVVRVERPRRQIRRPHCGTHHRR